MTNAAILFLLSLVARVAGVLAEAHASRVVGVESGFALGSRDVHTWAAAPGVLVLQSRPMHDLDEAMLPVERTITVCPGLDRAFDVVAENGLVIGETRTAAAAYAIALDYLAAPQLAVLQHEHDPVAV